MPRANPFSPCLALLWLALPTSMALAQPGASEADALFRQGRQLLAAGRFQEACEAFERSKKVDPALGTLLNLGDCYDKLGRTAAAWRVFQEAQAWANRAHQSTREKVAGQRVADLATRLSRIRVIGSVPRSLRVDNETINLDVDGLSEPVDPGRHAIEVTTGNGPWTGELDLAAGSSIATLPPPPPPPLLAPTSIAAADTTKAPPAVVVTPPDPGLSPAAAPVASTETVSRTLPPTASLVLMIAGGLVAIGGGVGMAYCWNVNGSVKGQQPGQPGAVHPTVTVSQYQSINTIYPLSLTAAAVGLVAAGTGLSLALMTPSPGSAGVSLRGTF